MSNLEDFLEGEGKDPFGKKKKQKQYRSDDDFFNLPEKDIISDKYSNLSALLRKNEYLEIPTKRGYSEELEKIKISKEFKKNEIMPKNVIYSSLGNNKYYNISKIFNSMQISPIGLNLNVKDSASVTADNIGEFALPIVEYIHQTRPDYVVASDRGARLLGLAVFRLHNLLYGRFPTADGTLRFRRFSKSNTCNNW